MGKVRTQVNAESKYLDKLTAVKGRVGSVAVTSDKRQGELEAIRTDLKAVMKEIDSTFDPIIKKAHETHKEAVAQKKRIADPYKNFITAINGAISKWITKKQADEQERLRKQQAELAKLREQETPEAEEKTLKVETKILSTIEKGKQREQGSYLTWSAEVVDTMTLIKAVAAGKAPIEAVVANQTYLNAQARKQEDELNIPGVKAVSKRVYR